MLPQTCRNMLAVAGLPWCWGVCKVVRCKREESAKGCVAICWGTRGKVRGLAAPGIPQHYLGSTRPFDLVLAYLCLMVWVAARVRLICTFLLLALRVRELFTQHSRLAPTSN